MKLLAIIAVAAAIMLAGCAGLASPTADDYQLGDNVEHYCETTSPTIRAAGRAMAKQAGLSLIDLCRAAGPPRGD
ncbi:hypothetical protein [Sphingomonas trueperi]|uniref:hypothetical protein n=1 Tax=Sphingomonas trueperi TaxID=53317 RepID=UPI0031D67212